jgi:hypothetical protein
LYGRTNTVKAKCTGTVTILKGDGAPEFVSSGFDPRGMAKGVALSMSP